MNDLAELFANREIFQKIPGLQHTHPSPVYAGILSNEAFIKISHTIIWKYQHNSIISHGGFMIPHYFGFVDFSVPLFLDFLSRITDLKQIQR